MKSPMIHHGRSGLFTSKWIKSNEFYRLVLSENPLKQESLHTTTLLCKNLISTWFWEYPVTSQAALFFQKIPRPPLSIAKHWEKLNLIWIFSYFIGSQNCFRKKTSGLCDLSKSLRTWTVRGLLNRWHFQPRTFILTG